MSDSGRMSKKCVLLKDIKNYLKKLECGQLEIEAGQWELHKDILTMKKMFDELKKFKEDFDEMKKNNVEQVGLIRKLELALSHQATETGSKKSGDCEKLFDEIDKRMSRNCSKDPKKKSHIVQSEEIIEITSHVESDDSKSISNRRSEVVEDRKGKRETQRYSRSPIHSIIYFHKHTAGSGALNPKVRIPPKKKDNAMLQRYLNDSAKYLDKKSTKPGTDVPESTEIPESGNKEDAPCKSDSWKWFNTKSKYSNSRRSDRSTERECASDKGESIMPKTAPYDRKRKALFMSSYFNDKSKRAKMESTSYVCGVCKKSFHTKNLLRAHEVVHKKMSENSPSYKCNSCNNVYTTPGILKKHVRKCQLIRSLFRKS